MRISPIVCAAVLCALLGLAPLCPASQVKLPNDIAWMASSDAYKACLQQAYNSAGMRLRELAKAEKPGTWCVILDADETIIGNVEFQKDLALKGTEHSSGSWNEWCNRAASTALPGAKEFCALVRELGGKVIIISNRQAPTKTATVKNLANLGFVTDAVLFREGPYAQDRKKVTRREDVEKGTLKTLPAGMALPPLKILMLCGDEMHDLYDEEQVSFDQAKARFGRNLIILPNPMYGDWTKKGVYVQVSGPREDAPSSAAGAVPAAKSEKSEPAQPGTGALTPKEAMRRVGEDVAVVGAIVDVRTREHGPDALNFDKDPKGGLSVVIFEKEKFGDLKAKYEGKKIRVRGKVTEYRGAAQIKVSDPAKIEVIE